jgi:tetrahydromethanopterin S-methyltransferase subunit E
MWPYLLVFCAALAVDTIPIFAPPAWTVLIVLLVKFHLNPWLTVAIGVTGSTIGRYVLTRYIPRVSSSLVNQREDANLRYTLTPLSTTALFTAVAMARIRRPFHILIPFFFGRLITDGVLVFSGKYASASLIDLLHGQENWKGIVTLVVGLLIISLFLFVDWRQLLERKKVRFRFKILK